MFGCWEALQNPHGSAFDRPVMDGKSIGVVVEVRSGCGAFGQYGRYVPRAGRFVRGVAPPRMDGVKVMGLLRD